MHLVTAFKRVSIFSIFLLFVSVENLTAQIPQPMVNTYVNDYARVLNKKQKAALNKRIHQLEREKHIQLAVVIVNKIPSVYEIEDYSLLIARRWKVGENGRGLVYVAAIKQRKQRIEVSRDLEPIFTDEVNTDIMAQMKPFFKKKRYGAGLLSMVNSVSAAAPDAGPPGSGPANARNLAGVKPAMQTGGDDQKYLWVLGGIALFGAMLFARRNRFGGGFSRSRYSNFGGGISSNDNDSSDYGKWGSSRGGESSSSSGSKYSGRGTTSDW